MDQPIRLSILNIFKSSLIHNKARLIWQSPSINNKGHDKDITLEGVTYKLNWNDDKESVTALLEFKNALVQSN
jgi:hypothetical protein